MLLKIYSVIIKKIYSVTYKFYNYGLYYIKIEVLCELNMSKLY